MVKWLTRKDATEYYRIGYSNIRKLFQEYIKAGGEIIKVGRKEIVAEEQFTDFLLNRNEIKKRTNNS